MVTYIRLAPLTRLPSVDSVYNGYMFSRADQQLCHQLQVLPSLASTVSFPALCNSYKSSRAKQR